MIFQTIGYDLQSIKKIKNYYYKGFTKISHFHLNYFHISIHNLFSYSKKFLDTSSLSISSIEVCFGEMWGDQSYTLIIFDFFFFFFSYFVH